MAGTLLDQVPVGNTPGLQHVGLGGVVADWLCDILCVLAAMLWLVLLAARWQQAGPVCTEQLTGRWRCSQLVTSLEVLRQSSTWPIAGLRQQIWLNLLLQGLGSTLLCTMACVGNHPDFQRVCVSCVPGPLRALKLCSMSLTGRLYRMSAFLRHFLGGKC